VEILAAGGALVIVGIAVVAAIVLLVFLLIMVRAWYKVAKADQALVVVGKSQKNASGESSRISVITGGGALVNPLTQRAEMISLRARQIKMEPTAQASNGVTVNVSGVALVKIGSDPEFVRRAAERFLSQDGAIEQFTTEQLEGALRGVVATLTVEQLMKDRQKLSDQIAEGIKSDLLAQGLILDSFQIQGVTDKNGYIDALGATEVERVRREAEVARINAAREVRARQIATDEANLVEQTAFDKNSAAAAAEVGRARAEAEQAEALARAEREQAVLLQGAENKQAQLDADIKKVADASSTSASARRMPRRTARSRPPRRARRSPRRRRRPPACAPRPRPTRCASSARRARRRSRPRPRPSPRTRRRCSRSARSRRSCR
jgi:flotillin